MTRKSSFFCFFGQVSFDSPWARYLQLPPAQAWVRSSPTCKVPWFFSQGFYFINKFCFEIWNLMSFQGSNLRSWSMFIHSPCSRLNGQNQEQVAMHKPHHVGFFVDDEWKGYLWFSKSRGKIKMTNHKWDRFFSPEIGVNIKRKHHLVSFGSFQLEPIHRSNGKGVPNKNIEVTISQEVIWCPVHWHGNRKWSLKIHV